MTSSSLLTYSACRQRYCAEWRAGVSSLAARFWLLRNPHRGNNYEQEKYEEEDEDEGRRKLEKVLIKFLLRRFKTRASPIVPPSTAIRPCHRDGKHVWRKMTSWWRIILWLAPLHTKGVSSTGNALGEILGRYYVQTNFPGNSRVVALQVTPFFFPRTNIFFVFFFFFFIFGFFTTVDASAVVSVDAREH